MGKKLIDCPGRPANNEALNAHTILRNTHDSSCHFIEIFEKTRKARNAKGTPTDEEQDLLRAMLIFSSAGLDSMIKQLVKDALPTIILKDEGAKNVFRDHIARNISKGGKENFNIIISAIIEAEPRDFLIKELISDLTSSSLQSKDELLKIASYFDIPSVEIANDFELLKKIFDARNQITHEMDVDFNQPNRNRRPRSKKSMIEYTNAIFEIAAKFLDKVDKKL